MFNEQSAASASYTKEQVWSRESFHTNMATKKRQRFCRNLDLITIIQLWPNWGFANEEIYEYTETFKILYI